MSEIPSAPDERITAAGGCLCGRVRWRAAGALRPIVACHCTQCRRQSTHFMAFSSTDVDTLTITGEDGITWFRASDSARRGFCATCGSHLFWHGDGRPDISIGAGSIDGATGLKFVQHIYCADKGDYYDLTDGIEQLVAG